MCVVVCGCGKGVIKPCCNKIIGDKSFAVAGQSPGLTAPPLFVFSASYQSYLPFSHSRIVGRSSATGSYPVVPYFVNSNRLNYLQRLDGQTDLQPPPMFLYHR